MKKVRTRICVNCGNSFSYEIGKGKDRKHCSDICRKDYRLKLRNERIKSFPKCKTSGCVNKATRKGAGLCEVCYYRLRRTGTTEKRKPKGWHENHGYVVLFDRSHPLTNKSGMVRAHRVVAYKKYGPGPQSCHWCGISLTWVNAVVDHVNSSKQDNSPDNLVISCNNCNRARGAILPFIRGLSPESLKNFIDSIDDYWNQNQIECDIEKAKPKP